MSGRAVGFRGWKLGVMLLSSGSLRLSRVLKRASVCPHSGCHGWPVQRPAAELRTSCPLQSSSLGVDVTQRRRAGADTEHGPVPFVALAGVSASVPG